MAIPSPRARLLRTLPESSLTAGALLLVAALAVYPVAVFILTSFRRYTEAGPGAFTVANYVSLFTSPLMLQALGNTLLIATATAICAGILGTLLAWVHARTDMPCLSTLEPLTVVPFFLSPFIGAIAWWILAAPKIGILNTWAIRLLDLRHPPFNIYSLWGIILVMTLFYTPYVYLFTGGSFRRMDPALEESARICGTGIARTALRVTIPLSTPAILSGLLIIFVVSAGAFGVPLALGVPARIHTLSTQIFIIMEKFPPDTGGAAAAGGVLVLLTAGGVWLQRRVLAVRSYITVTGKGFRPQRMSIGRWGYAAMALNLGYILLAIVLPMAALLLASLNRIWLGAFQWDQVTADNWRNIVFHNDLARRSIRNSLALGIGGALLCVLLCAVVAFLIHRGRGRLRAVLDYLTTLPVGVPGIVMGMAFLIAWIRTPLYAVPVLLLTLAYMTRYLPYGLRTVSSVLLSISPELEESSRVCGASMPRTLRRVTVPLLRPGMVSAYLLLFIVFVREYPVSLLLWTEQSVPMAVALIIMRDNEPLGVVAAFALLQTVLLLVAVLVLRAVAGERELRV